MEREYPNGREQKLTNKVMNAVSSVEKDRVESELWAFDLYDALKNRQRFYGISFLNWESIWVSQNAGKIERQAENLMHFVLWEKTAHNLSYEHLIM